MRHYLDGAPMTTTDQQDLPTIDPVLAEVRKLREDIAELRQKRRRPYNTAQGYALRWRVSLRMVRAWLAEGLPRLMVGRGVRIPVDRADAWVEARYKGQQPKGRLAKGESTRVDSREVG